MSVHPAPKQRREILAEHGNCCDFCSGTKRLELHHTDYSKTPQIVVCKRCHSLLHKIDNMTHRRVPNVSMSLSLRRRLRTVAKKANVSMQAIAVSGVEQRVESWEGKFAAIEQAKQEAERLQHARESNRPE